MLNRYEDVLRCDICGQFLQFDGDSTVEDYTVLMTTNVHNIHDKVDDLLNDYLVYTCNSCGRKHKYTTKKVEFLLRKDLTKKALMVLIKGLMSETEFITDSYLIYCGKCQGLDGKGGCSKSIYNSCEIKRFPINECL
jgi:hypothetical protein